MILLWTLCASLCLSCTHTYLTEKTKNTTILTHQTSPNLFGSELTMIKLHWLND